MKQIFNSTSTQIYTGIEHLTIEEAEILIELFALTGDVLSFQINDGEIKAVICRAIK